jgi:hypothetical protein
LAQKIWPNMTNEHHVFPCFSYEKWWKMVTYNFDSSNNHRDIGIEPFGTILWECSGRKKLEKLGHLAMVVFLVFAPEPSHLCAVRPKNPFLRWEDPYPSINEAWSHISHLVHRIRRKNIGSHLDSRDSPNYSHVWWESMMENDDSPMDLGVFP